MNDDPRYEMSGERLGPRVSEPAQRGEREGAWYRALPAPEPSFLERALGVINHPLNQWAGGPGKFVHAGEAAGGALGGIGALAGMLKGERGLRSFEGMKSLADAKKLAQEGRLSETWEQTGWEQGPGGHWWGHIAGPNPTLDRSKLGKWNLQSSYDDPGLFAEYPQLGKLSLRQMSDPTERTQAQYIPRQGVIELNRDWIHNPATRDRDIIETLGHELGHGIQFQQRGTTPFGAADTEFLPPQHAIRKGMSEAQLYPILEEAFKRDPDLKSVPYSDLEHMFRLHAGTKYYNHPPYTPQDERYIRELQQRFEAAHPEFRPHFETAAKLHAEPINAFNKYWTTAGETQARAMGKRVGRMTEGERRAEPPSRTEDVPRRDQWIRSVQDYLTKYPKQP